MVGWFGGGGGGFFGGVGVWGFLEVGFLGFWVVTVGAAGPGTGKESQRKRLI